MKKLIAAAGAALAGLCRSPIVGVMPLLGAVAACSGGAGAQPTPGGAETRAAERRPPVRGALLGIALGGGRVCANIGGSIHCGSDWVEGAPLASEPRLEGIEDAVSLALGRDFGCAVARRGTVHCFGRNAEGQLGAMLRDEAREKPVLVPGITDAVRVVAGEAHACAILADGGVQCWGWNASGQTGSSVFYERVARELVAPARVPALANVTAIAASMSATCALTKERETFCWGESLLKAQKEARGDRNEQPFRVEALAGLEHLAADNSMATHGVFCGVRGSEIVCWGHGSILVPPEHWREGEVMPIPMPPVKHVSVGVSHACAVGVDGKVYCFGKNYFSALGRRDDAAGRRSDETLPPAPVQDLPPAVNVVVGPGSACAITEGSEVYCWGQWLFPDKTPRKAPARPGELPVYRKRVDLVPVKLRIHD